MAEIIIRNLRKEFGDFTAVQSSSFKIEDGEFFMLLGSGNLRQKEDCLEFSLRIELAKSE